MERGTPGIAALFSGLSEDGSHSVLDLGCAAEANLGLYARYSRRIRIADLLTDPPHGAALAPALEVLEHPPDHPYDCVLAWDVFDRLAPDERPLLVERLVHLTAPRARLYLLVDASGKPTTRPLHFSLISLERVRQRPFGSSAPAQPQILPAEVKRMLKPFKVSQAFALRQGLREYVAVK